jgi:hypothetical protein
MDAGEFVVSALASRLSQTPPSPHCSKEEAELLAAISQGLPEPLWQRYRSLLSQRDAGTLTANEQAELIELSNQIEEDHARRLELLARLATLRNESLAVLMQEMGIRPPHG